MTFPKRKTLIPLIAIAAIFSMIAWSQYQKYQNVNRYVSNGKFPDITLLMSASSEGDIEQVQSLLNRGADITLTNDFGRTALYYAIGNATQTGNHDIVKLLLDAGADINDHYPEGYIDLHYCILSTAVPYSTSSPETLELFSNLANLNPHNVSNHRCEIAKITVMYGKPKTLELFLNSIDPDSASWTAHNAQRTLHSGTLKMLDKLKSLDPEILEQINDILDKYK